MAAIDDIQHLVPALQRGDAEAFRQLVRALSEPLYGYAYSIVANGDPAQDIVQETFIGIYKAASRDAPITSLRSFCFHIATKRAYSALRVAASRARRENKAAQAMSETARSSDPAEWAQAREAWEMVGNSSSVISMTER